MKIKNIFSKFYIQAIIVLFIFLLDRISKLLVINLDKNSIHNEIYSSKFLNIQLIWNEGIAFGLFSANEHNLYNLLTFLIISVILIILYMLIKSEGLKKYALLMIFSGAIGNVFDRITYRAVPDFIDFHVENFHWFIFNVADIFITIGVVFMIILELASKNNQRET